MSLISSFLAKIEEIFLNKTLPKTIAVALSGGADSLALTLLLQEFCQREKREEKIELVAITIDHKMRQGSLDEARQLGELLAKQKISHHILEIPAEKIPQKNIEAKLREVRYELLHGFCSENKIEFLFLGHQLDDVAENFLIRLFRGSGLDGLSPIAEISEFRQIKLVRPLLTFEKDDLKEFLQSRKIVWFEDESNQDERFLRNKIRNFFNSFPEKNLIQKRIKKSADEIAKMRDLFDWKMLSEAAQILEFRANEFFLIDQKKLCESDENIALKILALVAMEVSGKSYKPRLSDLKKFYQYLLTNSKIKPRGFYGCEVEQYDVARLIVRPREAKGKFELRTVLKSLAWQTKL
jgi:tRNA(Ile)-lysidine synthase